MSDREIFKERPRGSISPVPRPLVLTTNALFLPPRSFSPTPFIRVSKVHSKARYMIPQSDVPRSTLPRQCPLYANRD